MSNRVALVCETVYEYENIGKINMSEKRVGLTVPEVTFSSPSGCKNLCVNCLLTQLHCIITLILNRAVIKKIRMFKHWQHRHNHFQNYTRKKKLFPQPFYLLNLICKLVNKRQRWGEWKLFRGMLKSYLIF